MRSHLPRALYILLFAGLACGESQVDVFLRGLEIEGAAERGPCRLYTSTAGQPPTLSASMVRECLRQTERALEVYDKAAAMGLADRDFARVHERARDRKARLESMLRMVRMMERDREPPSGLVPPSAPEP